MQSLPEMNPSNPYAAPSSVEDSAAPHAPSALGELVKGWEKLRLLYNGVLLIPGIAVLAVAVIWGSLPLAAAIISGLVCGLGANAAFFAGPLAELYLRAIFFKGSSASWLRKALLIGGFLISFGSMVLFLIGVVLNKLFQG